MNYAIVEKNSRRAIAIVDAALSEWFKQNMPMYIVLEIESVGSTSFSTDKGTINTISIVITGCSFKTQVYHMINWFPNTISLKEAYDIILK